MSGANQPEVTLILAAEVQRDMLSYTQALGDQIEEFILRLAKNPFAPAILKDSAFHGNGSYSHRLESGCYVFWEILHSAPHPRFGSLQGTVVRVTGARFDFAAG